MAVTNILILAAFLILGMVMIIQYVGLHYHQLNLLGHPSIVKIHFYSGKIALFIPWLFFIAKAIVPTLGYIEPPDFLVYVSLVLLYAGVAGMFFGLLDMGRSFRVGLSEKGVTLATKGIFRFSRNPLYLSVFLIAIASCLYFPDLINITFTIYGIIIHHLIIIQEEKHLTIQYGSEYETYRKKVRRYL